MKKANWVEDSGTGQGFCPSQTALIASADVVEDDPVEEMVTMPPVEAVAPVQPVEALSVEAISDDALDAAEAAHGKAVEVLTAAHEKVEAAEGAYRKLQRDYESAIDRAAEEQAPTTGKPKAPADASAIRRDLEVGAAIIAKLTAKWTKAAAAERAALAKLRAIQAARHAAAIVELRRAIADLERQIADLNTGIAETEAARLESVNESARLDAENREHYGLYSGTLEAIKTWSSTPESAVNPLQLADCLAKFENYRAKRYAGSRNEVELSCIVQQGAILFSRQTGEVKEMHPTQLANDNGEKWDYDSGMTKSAFQLRSRLAELNRMGANA